MMRWAVLCDFDHTISTEDATDMLLERFALPEWRDIEAAWERGDIGSRECMQRQVALIRASREAMDEAAAEVKIDPHFARFARLCQEHGVPLSIVSDGLDYVIERVLNRHDIPHSSVIASHLRHRGGELWELSSPFANPDCQSQQSTCKCEMSRRMRVIAPSEQILYIGDGRSDYCVSMHQADLILAKDSLLGYCRQHQLPHRAFSSFAQASDILSQLLQPEPLEATLPAFMEKPLYV